MIIPVDCYSNNVDSDDDDDNGQCDGHNHRQPIQHWGTVNMHLALLNGLQNPTRADIMNNDRHIAMLYGETTILHSTGIKADVKDAATKNPLNEKLDF